MAELSKVAVITGAAGDIGWEICTRLLDVGYHVAAADVNEDALEQRISTAKNGQVLKLVMDITDITSVEAGFAQALEKFGRIDLLVNNAGGISSATLAKTSEADWLGDIDLNLNGPWRCINAVRQPMIDQGGGTIINIASVNGIGVFGHPGYSSAKAGLIHLTRFMAVEFGKHDIRSLAICPGSVRTQAWKERAETNPEILQQVVDWYPSRDICNPQDIAAMVAAMAQPEMRMANGSIITMDGGLTAGTDRLASQFAGEAV